MLKHFSLTLCFLLGYIFLSNFLPVQAQAIIDKEQPGSIRIYKYAVDDIENYTAAGAGAQRVIGGLPVLPNISFTVTRVQDGDTQPSDAAELEGDAAYSRTIATDNNGLAEFTGLAHGVYLIQELESAAVKAPVEDFLVDVPMTNPSGNGWIYDIYVYPKNELAARPGIDLYISSTDNKYQSADLGSEITWIAASEIPADIASSATQYEVQFTTNEYLTYQPAEMAVYYPAENGIITLIPLEDYTSVWEDRFITVTLTQSGKEKIAGASADTLYTEFHTLFQTDTAQLKEILGIDITADASLAYTNELGIPFTSKVTDAPAVYTGGLGIVKADPRKEIFLEGAVFKIYRTMEDAKAGENAVPKPGGQDDWEVRTDTEGNAGFYGLSYGSLGIPPTEAEMKYYLVEVKAPAGYNLLAAPVEVTVNSASHQNGHETAIANRSGFTLPATGGTGIFLFIGIGILILIAAWILYKTTRSKKHEK